MRAFRTAFWAEVSSGQAVQLCDACAYRADGFAVGEASQSELAVVLRHTHFRLLRECLSRPAHKLLLSQGS
jgi:hypothetical protein